MIHHLKYAYFIGIGGIGMSAIARYFHSIGIAVSGYDKTPTSLTDSLIKEGIQVHFDDNVDSISNDLIQGNKNEVLIVVTPAIPANHSEYNYFKAQQFTIKKRAEVLGMITQSTFNAAVAGTHGKTTTSCMLTHILKHSGYDVTAFLGGISKNYNTNFIAGNQINSGVINHLSDQESAHTLAPVVVEADEYDRSFLTLHPDIAIVTSVDSDHLDIYGNANSLKESFGLFTAQVKSKGSLITKAGLSYQPICTNDVQIYHYAVNQLADFSATEIKIVDGTYTFKLNSCIENIDHIELGLPGLHNVENSVAAIAAAQIMGVSASHIQQSLASFTGVNRRFDIRFKTTNFVYIDDYAHHPEEIKAFVNSVKQLFPNKRITGIFQPHLFSRTRDFAAGFSESLSLLDEVILMEIYPARELPISGVSSEMLMKDIDCNKKQLLNASEILEYLKLHQPEVLVTIGAGDIDKLVEPIENLFTHAKNNQ